MAHRENKTMEQPRPSHQPCDRHRLGRLGRLVAVRLRRAGEHMIVVDRAGDLVAQPRTRCSGGPERAGVDDAALRPNEATRSAVPAPPPTRSPIARRNGPLIPARRPAAPTASRRTRRRTAFRPGRAAGASARQRTNRARPSAARPARPGPGSAGSWPARRPGRAGSAARQPPVTARQGHEHAPPQRRPPRRSTGSSRSTWRSRP